MSKKPLIILAVILGCAFIGGFALTQSKSSLSEVMRKHFATVIELQPLISDPKAFQDKKNEAKIQGLITKLEGLSDHLKQKIEAKGSEETKGIAVIFEDYVDDIAKGFKDGHKDYVRHQLRTVTHFCISCHTNMETDKSWMDASKQIESTDLNPLNKAEFFAASRQFDKALKEYDKVIKSESRQSDQDYRDLVTAIKGAFNLGVSVKKDPEIVAKTLSSISGKDKLPYFLKRNIEEWQKDLENWKTTKNELSLKPSYSELMEASKAMINQAHSHETVMASNGGQISWLRAANLVQQALDKAQTKEEKARVYKYLGVIYSSVEDPILWDLDSYYYQQCIYTFPHSDTAKECFNKVASKMYFGYSGSQGTDIPQDEANRIKKLRELAE